MARLILFSLEELFVSDVFAYFQVVLETTEFYYSIKKLIFWIVEALFESQFANGYSNFYFPFSRKDLIEALLVASILFQVYPIFNQIYQTISPLTYATSKG